ncbi:MAG: DsrE family protein [Pseudomonadota bacterium]
MSQPIAVLQTAAAHTDAATEALDLALALASMDQPVQLVLLNEAVSCISDNPSKRYAMLELLDAEPILVCSDKALDEILGDSQQLDVEILATEQLSERLASYHEVLQFS